MLFLRPHNGVVILKEEGASADVETVGFQSPQWGSNSKEEITKRMQQRN